MYGMGRLESISTASHGIGIGRSPQVPAVSSQAAGALSLDCNAAV